MFCLVHFFSRQFPNIPLFFSPYIWQSNRKARVELVQEKLKTKKQQQLSWFEGTEVLNSHLLYYWPSAADTRKQIKYSGVVFTTTLYFNIKKTVWKGKVWLPSVIIHCFIHLVCTFMFRIYEWRCEQQKHPALSWWHTCSLLLHVNHVTCCSPEFKLQSCRESGCKISWMLTELENHVW